MERLCEINCPSLGFHAILDTRDTSSVGQTQSRTLDKVRERENRAKQTALI